MNLRLWIGGHGKRFFGHTSVSVSQGHAIRAGHQERHRSRADHGSGFVRPCVCVGGLVRRYGHCCARAGGHRTGEPECGQGIYYKRFIDRHAAYLQAQCRHAGLRPEHADGIEIAAPDLPVIGRDDRPGVVHAVDIIRRERVDRVQATFIRSRDGQAGDGAQRDRHGVGHAGGILDVGVANRYRIRWCQAECMRAGLAGVCEYAHAVGDRPYSAVCAGGFDRVAVLLARTNRPLAEDPERRCRCGCHFDCQARCFRAIRGRCIVCDPGVQARGKREDEIPCRRWAGGCDNVPGWIHQRPTDRSR